MSSMAFPSARCVLSRCRRLPTPRSPVCSRLPFPSLSYSTLVKRSSTPRPSDPHVVGGVALAVSLSTLYFFSPRILLDSKPIDVAPPEEQSIGRLIPFSEVQKHGSPDNCWVVIQGKVYDLTEFAKEAHPGGPVPIYRAAGHDATTVFGSFHPPGTIENSLEPEACLGLVDPNTLPHIVSKAEAGEQDKERKIELDEIIGLPDFDAAARRNLTSKAWAYMSAGATDMYTVDLNRTSFNRILFRPRIMVDVDLADTRTTMLGHETSLPVFLCPTGSAGLAHPLGERAISAAAGESDAILMVSTNASAPLDEIIGARASPDQTFFMQLYVDRNRPKTERLVKKINDLGIKAIFVTVDSASPGKREADERGRAEAEMASGISGGGKITSDAKGGGIGRLTGGFIDPKLNWSDIAWLRKHTKLPIGLKGVQTVEDCMRAAEMGVDAIYLSNHGGRNLDTSPPALYTLLEMNRVCPEIFNKCEVYVDGGVRRGTDVVKALCLGAKGVGLGRPFLYSLTYGQEGVARAIEIIRDEITTTMRLIGVSRLDQLGPHLLNTKALDHLILDRPDWGPRETRYGEKYAS